MQQLDNAIILKFKHGDESAFNQVYKHFYKAIFTFCRHLVPLDEARDIAAETFVALWRLREQWEHYTNVKAFLYITARNRCFSFLRSDKTRSDIRKEITELTKQEQQLLIYSEIESEVIASIQEAVERLPEYHRQVLKLSYYQGYRNQEIADMLGVNEKTVRNVKSLALKEIKDILSDRKMQAVFVLLLAMGR